MKDERKKWIKAKLYDSSDEKEYSVKIKLHGGGLSFISNGSLGLKVKHKSDGPYYKKVRQYNLMPYRVAGKTSTISLNKIAKSFGLIASNQRATIVTLNGVNIGAYRFEESISQHHYLEKEYKIPKHSIIKSNDDFDRKFDGDISDKELYSEFYEVDGPNEELNQIALTIFDLFLDSIKNENIENIKKFIDLDYFAKFFALLNIQNFAEVGSDMKYIYDHDQGKFYLYYRAEDHLPDQINNFSSIGNFNKLLFKKYKSDTLNVFKILLQDEEFVSLRNKHLLNIINRKKNIIKIIEDTYFESETVILNSNSPRSLENYQKQKIKNIFLNNLAVVENYLNYSKIYVTNISNNKISILSDIFVDHELIGYVDHKNENINFSNPILLKKQKNLLNDIFVGKDVYKPQILDLNMNKILNFE